MASFRKMKSGWRAEVCVKGVRDSAVRDTKGEARAWADERECELKLCLGFVDIKSDRTVNDLFDRYLREVSKYKKGAKWEATRISLLMQHRISTVLLDEVSSSDIAQWRDWRLRSVKGSTVNREMNIISNAFQVGVKEWKWLKESPCKDVKRPKDSPPRERRISEREISLVRLTLDFDEDVIAVTGKQRLAVAFLFAIETAMRLGEICSLGPDDIVGRVATIHDSKNGTKRKVPLSNRAVELLSFLPEHKKLFNLKSPSSSTLFRKYISPITHDLTFHDTRHEGITRLAAKMDVLDLARMVGHGDIRMLMIYYNKSAEDLASQLD